VRPPETFDTPRLRLRRPLVSDAEAIYEYGSDPEVARYADWPVRADIGPLVESLKARAATWETGDEYSWVVTVRPADRAVGGVTCRVAGHSAELGYLLHREYWGWGYATEAAGAVVEWLSSRSSLYRIWATCDAENAASARVLEKLGFEREGVLRRYAVRPQLGPEPRDALMYGIEVRKKTE